MIKDLVRAHERALEVLKAIEAKKAGRVEHWPANENGLAECAAVAATC